ncbi:MAG TPA: ATP-binding protein [Candidatus Kapabacteria bacterium]|nr:ATP-binding protein [Candidatus Kapabacteria bacterium]
MIAAWRRIIWLLIVVFAFPCVLHAQRSTHVRPFRPSGSYPANITISPIGTIVSRSGENRNVLLLDGYTRTEIPMEVETSYRVYQSRSAQLWSVTRDGLQLYHQNEWTLHPISEIRSEFSNYPIRQLRQISLLPAEVGRVFILLSDRLLEYEAGSRKVGIIKSASETKIGDFLEIQEGVNETIWISGTLGWARLSGPMRRVSSETEWTEYVLPNTNEVHGLQRPFEFPATTVTSSANSTRPDGTRFIVRLQDGEFSSFPVPGEKIKQGWTAWDNSIWGYSSTALFRLESEPLVRLRKEPVSGTQYDIACETNGVFWIASSEGLLRYAPFLWRAPTGLDDLQSSIHSIAFSRQEGTVWAASPEGLIQINRKSTAVHPWPESIENIVLPRATLNVLADGRVLMGTGGKPLLFDPKAGSEGGRFTNPPTPTGVQANVLGALRDGRVCVLFQPSADEAPDLRGFDGKTFERLTLPSFDTKGAELLVARETSRGDLWLGTSQGLIQLRLTEGTAEYHGREQGLPNERITIIQEIAEGQIWCGTETHVFEFSQRRWERRLKTQDRVNSIVAAAGSIWVSTQSVLYRFLEGSWIIHKENEGLHGGGAYALERSPANELWAATSRGALVFHADADLDAPRTWPPLVQDAEQLSTLEPTTITFLANDKWDYTAPADLLFSFKLDEAPWSPFTNQATRVFQNLASGKHVIEVRAMDKNGNQSSVSSQVEFAVIVPWFQDPRLLVVLVFAGCVTVILAGYATVKHFQLKRSYAEVEEIVKQRTGELQKANQELLHSQKMRAIGTMAAGIAHDFNNILSIIKGSAQIIEGNVDDKDKIKTRVNRIQTVVEQGTTIVKALLGLGRISEQEVTSCRIGELLQETRKLLSDRFSTDVSFELKIQQDLPETICSPEVLQQMLLNFILNAVEAMGGKGVVQLSARETTTLPQGTILEPGKAKSYIDIAVKDNGSGIASGTLPRIFEPFFTTKGFSSRRGTGLGLSMVYQLAKGLGYGVSVQSAVGKGSSFSIIVPFKTQSDSVREPRIRETNDESDAVESGS